MATTKFTKGQIVYQAAHNFAAVGASGKNNGEYVADVMIGVVIERQIDACGQKKASFYSRSQFNDSAFGKSINITFNKTVFATPEEAFESLRAEPNADVICPDVYSDADSKAFDDLRSGKMRIAAK